MSKKGVVLFAGEDKFITKKKHVYSKTQGQAKFVSAEGNEKAPSETRATPVTVVSTSTVTQDSAAIQPPQSPITPAPKAPSIGTYAGNEAPPSVTNQDQYRAQTPAGTVSTVKPGQTFTKVCPQGTIWNDDNGACEPDPNYVSPAVSKQCADGQYFDPIYNKCIDIQVNCDPPKMLVGGKCVDAPQNAPVPTLPYDGNEKPPNAPTKCPDGFVWNQDNGACEKPNEGAYTPPANPTQCADGEYFDPIYNKCIQAPTNCEPPNQMIGGKCVGPNNPTPGLTKCPDNFIFDEVTAQCVPYTKTPVQYTTTTTTLNPDCGSFASPSLNGSCPDGFQLCPADSSKCIPVDSLVTTSTTTSTTTSIQGSVVIVPGLGEVPTPGPIGGGGGGGGGSADDSTPAPVKKKSYFWWYVAAGVGIYLLMKKKKK